jgi:hypothetical protein
MDRKIRYHFYEFLFDYNRQLTLKNNKNYSIIKTESMSKDKHHDFQEEQFYLNKSNVSRQSGQSHLSRLHDKSIGINKTKPI